MHVPSPDPTGRPSSAKHSAGRPADSSGQADPGKGSTGSHPQPAPEPSLSDLLRGNSSSARRVANPTALVAHLAAPGGAPPPDSDDAPTVITQAGKDKFPPLPPPPYVVGETPSIAGRRLGHFELIGAIGAGGMAAVLKARDLELGRPVALKILPPESTHDPENVTRFKQEARAAAKLDHENIARVYFCGEDQGLHFIAFEFVEGITLRQMIDRRGPLPAGDCVRYMIQVAAGLTHAAERGVVHRDIKPSNIIITPDGRAKIVDMGLARHLDSGSVNGGVTQSGVTLGTFDYISPEQALDPRQADTRSDIYSLGCAFYHALTGRPPVPEGNAAKKLNAHQHIDPLDPRELNPAIPDELAAVLARMMAKDPARRYQSPPELIAHLKAVAERLRIPLDAVASDSTVQAVVADDRVLPHVPRLRLGWVAAAAAVVAATVVIVVSAMDPASGPTPPPWPLTGGNNGTDRPVVDGPTPNRSGTPAADGEAITTAEGLANALATGKKSIRLARGVFDLTRLDRAVTFQGPELELVGSGIQTEIRLAPSGRATPGSLVVRARSVSVEGVRFVMAPPPGWEEAEAEGGEPVGLAVRDADQIDLRDCVFDPDTKARRAGLVAVNVGPPAAERPVRVHLERCLFAPGAVGLRVPARSDVDVTDSGFGPHAAAIQVRDDAAPGGMTTAESTPVRLDRSSFMLDWSCAAVKADGDRDVRVTAGYCVFASVTGAVPVPRVLGTTLAPRGSVVRTARDTVAGVLPTAAPNQKNVYYRVDAVATPRTAYSFADRKDEHPSADAWVHLDRRPWDAPQDVLAPFSGDAPWRAFRLRIVGSEADRHLFVTNGTVRVVGAQFAVGNPLERAGRAYTDAVPAWPPPNPGLSVARAVKVWAPAGREDEIRADKGEYTNLVNLLQDVRSGDTILVRGSGEIKVPQVDIKPPRPVGGADRGEFHLTFRPEPGSHPVLIPEPSVFLDLALFRVVEGQVTFDGLDFRLKPGANQSTLAAVALVAARGCTFAHCTFTLDEADDTTAAVVTVADPGSVMKMDGPASRSVPRVAFRGCLVRGKGRAVALPASRPFALDMEQCVSGLNGPVVYAKAGGRDPGAATPATVRLTRVTALLGGPLVELHGGKVGEMRASGLVPTTVTASACLFAAVPGAGRPIIEVTGTELDPTDPNRVLKWERGDPNRFANFDPTAPIAVVRPDGETMQSWDWDQWIGFAREVGRPVGRVTFADEPAGLYDLPTLTPADADVRGVDFPDLTDPKPDDAGAKVADVARPPE